MTITVEWNNGVPVMPELPKSCACGRPAVGKLLGHDLCGDCYNAMVRILAPEKARS